MMSVKLAALMAAMSMRRRSDDENRDPAMATYAKQVAPVVVAILAAVGGARYAPLPPGQDQQAVQKQLDDLSKRMDVAIASQHEQGRMMDRTSYALQTLAEYVGKAGLKTDELERRVRVCEIDTAKRH